ncbi:hypothetical protein DLM76_14330 [Leptospira yasudae]|uniref:Uncharacterized protein n=1 Tax=Leptospira yasudae TaxID=2202201 RepID=A0ABX9M1R8_9LEPT|nr:hypothetical protein DLM77_15080 [Leptospira yasudae]RHX93264.1 hypothetical protein DLM76_14330 [Leptospira yasudae]
MIFLKDASCNSSGSFLSYQLPAKFGKRIKTRGSLKSIIPKTMAFIPLRASKARNLLLWGKLFFSNVFL